jgi:dTDP-4-dehydrorhamnose reductase
MISECTRRDLDVANEIAVAQYFRTQRPNAIINAAVYLAADQAERESDLAQAVNAHGPRYLALGAREIGARLVQISTAYVFDGSDSMPYKPDAQTNPLSIYARTKRDGENAVRELAPDLSVVLRTSWLYAAEGKSFLQSMLRDLREKGFLRAAVDQIGTPTSAKVFAQIIWKILEVPKLKGIHHWTDSGVASWYDVAVAIAEEASVFGMVPYNATIIPILADQLRTAARRPRYSVLDTSSLGSLGIQQAHWRSRLRTIIREMSGAKTKSV